MMVRNCVDAMLHVTAKHTAREATHRTRVYHLGTPEYVEVNQSIGYIWGALGMKPQLDYMGGKRGRVGDNPLIFLDTRKILATGWKSKLTIAQAVERTLRWIEAKRWVYEARKQ